VVALNKDIDPVCGVIFATARDGGTARTSAGRTLPAAEAVRIPVALVLSGPGWAERNETAALATAFDGRIFSERYLDRLATEIERLM
jgi:hypothetical protein